MAKTAQWVKWIPLVFVLLWSTGFIAAKFALPFIEPFTLLFVRMTLTVAAFYILIHLFRSTWPAPIDAFHQMVVGSLIHACYLGGVFAAINLHMPAGVTSLIVGLQPILTAVSAWALYANHLRIIQWLGLILGFIGVTFVLLQGENIGFSNIDPTAYFAIIIALFGISLGVLYQKHFGQRCKLLNGSFYQYLATAIWMAILSFSLESQQIDWSLTLVGALMWLVIVLSIITILLLMVMIREGESTRVASYFYLVPPVVAVQGWLYFDEQFNLQSLIGIAVTVLGVYLVVKPARQQA